MYSPQPHVIVILILAILAAAVCHLAGGRLRAAGLTLLASFCAVLTGQLVFGMVPPELTMLTAVCDMTCLGVIGKCLITARQRWGLHMAGIAMCTSLMAHVLYHVFGVTKSTTEAYFLTTNIAMGVACLGLICSGLLKLRAGHGVGGGVYIDLHGRIGGAARVASRCEGQP